MEFSSILSSAFRLLTWTFRPSNSFLSRGVRAMSAASAAPSKVVKSPPWMMLPPSFEGGRMVNYNFYSLGHDKVLSFDGGRTSSRYEKSETSIIVGSSHGWLALFNPTNSELFLSNPLTGRHVSLPPVPPYGRHVGLLPHITVDDDGCAWVNKVIISGEDPEHEDCRALMIFGTCEILAFCCPGWAGAGWTRIGAHTYPPYNDVRGYEDMVYSGSENLFFCLTQIDSGDLEAWDLTDPTSPRLVWSNHKDLLGYKNYISWLDDVEHLRLSETGIWTRALRYLVYAEDLRQLFLVTRHLVEQMAPDGSSVEDLERDNEYPYKTVAFDVHKIDREEGGGGKLSYVDGSLSGLAMFVGLNHSCAVMATNDGLKPDSIYFTDDKEFNPRNSNYTDEEEKMYGGHDIGIYDYEKKTISPCYYPCEVGRLKRIMPSPIWFTPRN
ncbi:Unknown protein [Striga hermonthica]|uniref:KIB1-4 beta-propeller domain-containing protein n=1 Tax=Striga hermonthica TaxID=68872 RepID=A0A9N7NG17_STRHE|nr:Unknown protein [Striga hermonthica]